MSEPEEKKKGPAIDVIELVVLGLGRYRYWIVLFALIGLLVGVYQSISMPNMYKSSGKFLVKFGQLEKQTPETVAGINDGRTFAHGISDEIQILRSDALYKQVAKELGPAYILTPPADPTKGDGPHTPFFTRKMHELQKWLWFRGKDPDEPVPGEDDMNSPKAISAAASRLFGMSRFYASPRSSIMGVEATADSPEKAQLLCAKIMDMVQWRHTQVFSSLLSPDYLNEHLEDALREEDVKNDHFQQHTSECGFFDLPSRKGQVLGTIATLEDKIAEDELRTKEIEKELLQIEEDLAGIEPKIIELITPEEQPNPQYHEIQKRIQEEQKKLERLALDFVEGSRMYESRKSGIENILATLQAQLDATERFIQPQSYEKSIDNPRFVSLDDEKNRLERERERRKTGRESRIGRLATKHEELQDILDCEPIHRAMQNEIAQARGRVGQLSKALQNNETLRAITREEEASNLVVVQEASFNPTKAAPQRSKNVMSGLGGGFAAGAVFAILRQFLDTKLRFPRTAKRVVGVRVLGVVPEVRRWRKLGQKLQNGSKAA